MSSISAQGVVERASAELTKRINGLGLRGSKHHTTKGVMERVTNVFCGGGGGGVAAPEKPSRLLLGRGTARVQTTSATALLPPPSSTANATAAAAAARRPRPQPPVCLTWDQLMHDERFLARFFLYFTPCDRCMLARVCTRWRDMLYRSPKYWQGLVPVVQCRELRECHGNERARLYASILRRGFHCMALMGASDEDTFDLVNSFPLASKHIQMLSLRCSSVTDRGLETLLDHLQAMVTEYEKSLEFYKQQYIDLKMIIGTIRDLLFCTVFTLEWEKWQVMEDFECFQSRLKKYFELALRLLKLALYELELAGCNEVTEAGLWACLNVRIVSLTLTDCINVADEAVGAVAQLLPALYEFSLQAYHVTDAALGYFSPKQSNSLNILRLHSCWEITNHGVVNIVHALPNLTVLSLSGCSKITDDGVELIAENLQKLKSLDLSWCPRITDAALEYIACDLNQLEELTLDRCVHITDIGIGYISTMLSLQALYLRWCSQIRDFGLQHLCGMRNLKILSLAGCPLLTSGGLSSLIQLRHLKELELTNCPGASRELFDYLKEHLPRCLVVE